MQLRESRRIIHAQLISVADIGGARGLRSNSRLCWQGCKLVGAHFQIDPVTREKFAQEDSTCINLLPLYTAGSDLMKQRNERYVIDTYGLDEIELRDAHPALYQHLRNYVYPERMHNKDRGFKTRWWLMGRPRPEMRAALEGIHRYIATSEVSKHRVFVMLEWPRYLIDGSVIAIATEDSMALAILSSQVSAVWSFAAGGTLEDRPRYHTTTCFDPFPFPLSTDTQRTRLRALAEQLDAHRKRQQATHPTLTLTGMYNVLEKLRSGETLTAKERVIHEHGLVSVLRQLHDEIDAAVLDAYGWSDLLPQLRIAHGNTLPGTPAVGPEKGTSFGRPTGAPLSRRSPLAGDAVDLPESRVPSPERKASPASRLLQTLTRDVPE